MGVVSLAKKTSSGGDLIRRCGRASSLVLCLALGAGPALTQTAYPAKPIKIIVPYAPGGLTDVVARLYAEQLRQIFARGVVVENKPGASGIIAIEEMARARPDGYTIMIGNISTNGLTPVLLAKKMSIDYQRDVQVISQLADVPVFFLTTTTDFPPKTFPEFLVYAKEHPGKVRYASAGIGSYQQINTEILARRARLELVHIPFKGGGAEIIRDLANGDVHVSWFNITNSIAMMKAGRVRALAIAAERRLPQFADVPTLAEVGFPDMRAGQWVAAFARSALPPDIAETLNRAFAKAMVAQEMKEAFARGGMMPPQYTTLEDARAWLRDEMASWKRDVEALGIVVEENR
jgi:tripartite-type tricarboxylate transporter receptor subunit TctC